MTARKAAIAIALEGGSDLGARISPRLESLVLSEARENEADEMELRLDNSDGRLAYPETGATLSLALGWESGNDVPNGMVDKGLFVVSEVAAEGPPDVLVIRAQSADLIGELRRRRTKAWRDTTLGAILDEVAGRYDRTARVESGLAALAIEIIEQEGKSDMAFVAHLGRRYDAIATWKNGVLLFLPIGQSATASGMPLAGAAITKRDGWRWQFSQADRESYDGAEAQWQDQDAGRRRTVQVGGDNRRRLKRVYASEGEARQAAQAALSRAQRAPFRFTYELAIADPSLQPDMQVSLSGWSEKIDGMGWLVESVKTSFGAGGLRQSIELESA